MFPEMVKRQTGQMEQDTGSLSIDKSAQIE